MGGREQLQRGTTMLGRLATFQQQLGPVVAQFENVCGAEGKFNVDSISAIGDLILKMSDLFGNGDTATTRGASYVNNVVSQLRGLSDLSFGDVEWTRSAWTPCSSSSASTSTSPPSLPRPEMYYAPKFFPLSNAGCLLPHEHVSVSDVRY